MSIKRPISLGRLLESLRLCEELTQAAFAKRLKISRSHLNDIEKGRKAVSPERAARFAKILGHSEIRFVQRALQDLVNNAGLRFKVGIEKAS